MITCIFSIYIYIYICILQRCSFEICKNLHETATRSQKNETIVDGHIYIYINIYIYMHMYVYMCVCVSLCLFCGAVSRRVSRVVARHVLFVVRDKSIVVDCPSLCCPLWFCVFACCCCCRCGLLLVIGVSAYTVSVAPVLSHLLVACGIKWRLTASSGNANDWRIREHVVLDLFSKLIMGKIQGFLRWTSGARDNPLWADFRHVVQVHTGTF